MVTRWPTFSGNEVRTQSHSYGQSHSQQVSIFSHLVIYDPSGSLPLQAWRLLENILLSHPLSTCIHYRINFTINSALKYYRIFLINMFFSICALILSILIWYSQYIWKRRRLIKLVNKFDGPPTLPVLGNALQFSGNPKGELKLFVLL